LAGKTKILVLHLTSSPTSREETLNSKEDSKTTPINTRLKVIKCTISFKTRLLERPSLVFQTHNCVTLWTCLQYRWKTW
jgi:hypothetical protein